MEVVNANSAQLCNYEVMKHLQKLKDGRRRNKGQGQLATITYETLRYLEGTPASQQTNESVTKCTKALAPFGLSKNEKLMIVNRPPTTALEIQLMIEESEERLTEEQVQSILTVVGEHFLHTQKPTSEEGSEET